MLRQVHQLERRKGARDLQRHPLWLDPRKRRLQPLVAYPRLRRCQHHREHPLRVPDRVHPRRQE